MAMEDEFETDSKEDDEWKLHSWSQQNKTAPLGATTGIKVYDQQQWFYLVEITLVSSLINWCKNRSAYSRINTVPLYCTCIVYLWKVKTHKRATTKG